MEEIEVELLDDLVFERVYETNEENNLIEKYDVKAEEENDNT